MPTSRPAPAAEARDAVREMAIIRLQPLTELPTLWQFGKSALDPSKSY